MRNRIPFRNGRAIRRAFVGLVGLVLLSGCGKLAPYQMPFIGLPDRFAEGGAPVLARNDAWWTRLGDPALDGLVRIAFAESLTLAQARARLEEAQAVARGVYGGPDFTGRIEGRTGSRISDSLVTRFDLDWLFPTPEATKRAAQGRVEAAEAQVDAARLAVLSELAGGTVDLRYAQARLALREADLRNRRRTLALTRELVAASEGTRLDVTRAQARIAAQESQLPALRAEIDGLRNELAVLAGRLPGQVPLAPAVAPIPAVNLRPDVGIPADLLRNRPDIRAAEREYYVAVARITEAERARYPRLSLSGTVSIDMLSQASVAQTLFSPTLTLPSLPGTSATAEIDARRAAARQALLAWKSTVLTAVLQVENALLTYRAAHTATQAAARSVRLYEAALSQTRELFAIGEVTLGDIIDSEIELSQARLQLADARYRQALGFVDLNVQIGAGAQVD